MDVVYRMICTHTYRDGEIIRVIESMYPDPHERKAYINRRLHAYNTDTLLTESVRRHCRDKLTMYLVRNGADPNVISSTGEHSLNLCMTPDETMFLLAYGADPNTRAGDHSILCLHICGDRIDISNILMKHGARLRSGELQTIKMYGKKRIRTLVPDFYNDISLRHISLHHINLHRLRFQ